MPPSSSISSFRARRGAVAITAFALAFAAILASSAWRLDDRGVARTREDQLVHAVSKMRDVRARAIILGDSVTQVAAYSFKPAPAVYSLLTNGYLRLAGNYLLFRRFIEHNATKSMYLFVVPSLLSIDVSDTEGGGLARYTYVDSVFTRPEEVKILAEAGATPKRKIVSSFERLLKSWYPNNFSNPFGIGPFGVVPTDRLPQRYEGKRIPPWTTPQVRYFLDRFQKDCATHRIDCVIVQEPAPRAVPRLDVQGMRRLYPGLKWIDFHDYATFDDDAFADGLHLTSPARRMYVQMIETYIAPLFAPPGEETWTGERIAFTGANRASNPFTSTSFHDPEAWGVWTSSASADLTFKVANDLLHGEMRLAIRLPPERGWTSAWPVTLWLDGVEVFARSLPPGSKWTLAFKPPEALRGGSTHTLELRMPHSVRAPGADRRQLGVGIDYVEYCNAVHRCSPWR